MPSPAVIHSPGSSWVTGWSKFNFPLDHHYHRVAASYLRYFRGVCSLRQPIGLPSHAAWDRRNTRNALVDATCQLIALYSTQLRMKIRENWLLCGWKKKTSSARARRYSRVWVYRVGTVSENLCETVPRMKIFCNFLTLLGGHVSIRALCLRHNWQIAL
jgi:hypothetical protein